MTGSWILGSSTAEALRRWSQKRNGLRPGMQLLDVACGTGLVAAEAAKILGSAETITCLDPSEGMLAIARKRLAARFVPGRAEALPFRENSFDFLTMGYALRHVVSFEEAFGEFHRVLRPGGKVLILEVTKPSHRFGRIPSSDSISGASTASHPVVSPEAARQKT